MSVELDEFWIFTKNGKCILHITMSKDRKKMTDSEVKVDTELFQKFTNYIEKTLGKRSKKDYFSYNAGWGKYAFKYFYEGNFLLVYQSSLDLKEKRIKQFCQTLIDLFYNMYSLEDIKDWDGDPAFFKKFKSKLSLYIKMSSI